MTDLLPPSPKFNISKWLLSVIILTSVIGGGLCAVAALFMAEGFFDVGRDPAVQEEQQTDTHDAEFDKRLRALETQVAAQPVSTTPTQEQPREQKPDPVPSQDAHQDARMAKIVAGMTQLKAAYESDTSLMQGITTLKQAVNEVHVQENLAALTTMATNAVPTKEALLQQIATAQKEVNQPAAPPAEPTATGWKDRAKDALGRFVTVSKTEDVNRKKELNATYDKLSQAVSLDNYSQASQLVATLPDSAQNKTLSLGIEARNKTRDLVQKTITSVSNALDPQQGSLY